jgi:hypothetical protein
MSQSGAVVGSNRTYSLFSNRRLTGSHTGRLSNQAFVIVGASERQPFHQKLGLVENGVSCSSCVQQDLSCVCR